MSLLSYIYDGASKVTCTATQPANSADPDNPADPPEPVSPAHPTDRTYPTCNINENENGVITIHQNVVDFSTIKGSLNGEKSAAYIADRAALFIGSNRVQMVAFAFDRCTTNLKANRLVVPWFKTAHLIDCTLHTYSNCNRPDRFVTLHVDKYLKHVNVGCGYYGEAPFRFRTHYEEDIERSSVPWMSRTVQTMQHFRVFPHLDSFFRACHKDKVTSVSFAKAWAV
jgi:hypothetical protein